MVLVCAMGKLYLVAAFLCKLFRAGHPLRVKRIKKYLLQFVLLPLSGLKSHSHLPRVERTGPHQRQTFVSDRPGRARNRGAGARDRTTVLAAIGRHLSYD